MARALQIPHLIPGVLRGAICPTQMAIVIVRWNVLSVGLVQLGRNVINLEVVSLVFVPTQRRQSQLRRCSKRNGRLRLWSDTIQT